MIDQEFDSLARRAGSRQNRRTSLKALGATAAVALAATRREAEARKAGKKAKKKCKKQGKQCRKLVIEECEGDQECLEQNLPCCKPFARCKAAAGFACIARDDDPPAP